MGYEDITFEPDNMSWIPGGQEEGNIEPTEIHDVFHEQYSLKNEEYQGPPPHKISNPRSSD